MSVARDILPWKINEIIEEILTPGSHHKLALFVNGSGH